MTASAPIPFDADAIRSHTKMLHTLAAVCDGIIPLCVYGEDPDSVGKSGKTSIVLHFKVGDVDGMTAAALSYASYPHANVYSALAVMRRGLPLKQRGGKADIVAVLGAVIDSDADAGRPATSPVPANYIVQSSAVPADNRQEFLLFDRPLTVAEADPVLKALQRASGADTGTGDADHVWRVAGAANWPNRKKVHERNRPRGPQPVSIIKPWDGSLTNVDALLAVLEPHMRAAADPIAGDISWTDERTGFVDASVEDLVRQLGRDRSSQFYAAVKAARSAGMTPRDLEDMMRLYPDGCAAKYLESGDRLIKEIERAWGKLELRKAAPTYPGKPETSAHAARNKLRMHIENAMDGTSVNALSVSTGAGKTKIAARVIAERIRAGKLGAPVVYAVPTHKLGDAIAGQFREHGISAEVWRGRKARGADGELMCRDIEAVELATQAGEPVEASCCKGK